jgi:subtilisin family serine protease
MLGAWRLAGGGNANKKLAIVDTGVRGGMNANGVFESQHPDLGFIDGRNFTLPYVNGNPQRKKFNDDCNHGTKVAGIAGAFTNNGTGIAGGACNAPIWSLRVDLPGCSVDHNAAALAIDWAATHGAYAITASFTKYAPSDSTVQMLRDAIEVAWDNNVPVVTAAGNGDLNGFSDYVPARWLHVVTVGGTDSANARCRWTAFDGLTDGANYGAPGIDVAAPCEVILSTLDAGGYGYDNGTSLAVPYVAAGVYLMKSRYPSLTSQQIKNRLWNTADKVGGYNYNWRTDLCGGLSAELGCGLLDADGAVQ